MSMREIRAETAVDYLRETGRIEPGRPARAAELGWGVSNIVVRVDVEDSETLILKQSRARLRTQMEWISRIDRIWTEVEALQVLGSVLDPGFVPRVLFVDRENYTFAMSCAPEGSQVWKELLLQGEQDIELARRTGTLLGTIHKRLAGHPSLKSGPLADREVFDQLRIDPFYRTLAKAHPGLKPDLENLIESMTTCDEITFVHADFSPKNLLIAPDRRITLVDFETAHAGDPAFDVGFFLSHLFLKARRTGVVDVRGMDLVRAAWSGYVDARGTISDDLSRRSARHLAACALARVDGKSPVDYLNDAARDEVRQTAQKALRSADLIDLISS